MAQTQKLRASEAVYGFAAWLTTRKEKTVMSSKHDCAIVARLVNDWIKANKLTEPRKRYERALVFPKT
jgi:hypothetical protein